MPSVTSLRPRNTGVSDLSLGTEDGVEGRHKSLGGEVVRFFKDIAAAPDRGKSFYQHERQRHHLAALVEAGRHAGRSRVSYAGRNIQYHLVTKDFFITMINQKTTTILLITAAVYLAVFLFFSIWWYLIVKFYPGCLYGASSFVEAFTFAIVTQMTIGYGNTGPQKCWAAAWLIAFQIIIALLLESIVIGIVFARISHPKQRSRSIFISDSAIIARRDGILKFMFRVADIRRTQVVDPKIKAFMYTWGQGRVTAEGERIPVRCEPLDLGYIDGMLLLPLTIEHTIDERSPLCGHSHDSLMALNAEVVVTFEGTTEFGNPFMSRRSYLPTEIHWGHQFADIIVKPAGEDTRYLIDLNRFHDVLPQDGLPLLAPSQLSQLVVNRAKRTVPYPLLGENTLVLSDVLCIAPNEDGQTCLICRAADTYPNQMLEITVRMYLYRWRHNPAANTGAVYTQHALTCGYRTGEDRLYLRLPVEVCHVITEDSPIARWLEPGGLLEDADSEIVVLINSYLHVNGQNRLRQRTYTVHNHVRYAYRFQNIVKHPADSRDRKPRVRWAHFHDVQPLEEEELLAMPPRGAIGLPPVPSQPSLTAMYAKLPSIAPESHGALRSVEQRQSMWRQPSVAAELHAAAAASAPSPSITPTTSGGVALESGVSGISGISSISGIAGGGGGGGLRRTGSQQMGTLGSGGLKGTLGTLGRPPAAPQGRATMPHVGPAPSAAASAVSAAGVAGGPRYQPSAAEERNDYTVLPIDLSRYAATAGNEGDSIPLVPSGRRSPLPTHFAQALAAAAKHQEESEEGKSQPFLLFPEVASYALSTTDAADSLPHPQALHPTLPGPDSFRFDVSPMDQPLAPQAAQPPAPAPAAFMAGPPRLADLRNDYTILPMDLSRYVAEMNRSDTLMSRQTMSGPFTVGEVASVLTAQQQQGGVASGPASAAQSTTGAVASAAGPGSSHPGSGYATPLSAISGNQPLRMAQSVQGSGSSTPQPGPSPGSSAAAAALAAAAAAAGAGAGAAASSSGEGELPQGVSSASPAGQGSTEQGPSRRQSQDGASDAAAERQAAAAGGAAAAGLAAAGPTAAGPAAAGAAPPRLGSGLGLARRQVSIDSEQAAAATERPMSVSPAPSPPPDEEDEEARKDREELEQQLHRRLRRATSTRNLLAEAVDSEEEEEGAGPIHFSKEESWQRDRALKNLFAAPDSPEKGGRSANGARPGSTPDDSPA